MEMIATNKSNDARIHRIGLVLSICVTATQSFAQERVDAGTSASARSQEKTVSPDAGRHFAAAQAAEARLDLQTAVREYEAAIEIAPQWAEAIVNLGIVYNRQANADKAIAAFTRAAEINPRLLGAQLNLAITYFRAQRYGDAEMPLRRALEIDPSNHQAEGLQVLSLFALDRYAEVADLAEKRIAKGSSDAAMVEILGRAYMKLHRYDEAVRTLEIRTGLQPMSAEAYLLLGEARDNAGDSEGAIKDFGRAIAMSGDKVPPELHFAHGYVLWKMRRYDEAEVAFRHALERKRDHARSLIIWGTSATGIGRTLRFLEQAAGAMPHDCVPLRFREGFDG
jgi:superkiller protein 3